MSPSQILMQHLPIFRYVIVHHVSRNTICEDVYSISVSHPDVNAKWKIRSH